MTTDLPTASQVPYDVFCERPSLNPGRPWLPTRHSQRILLQVLSPIREKQAPIEIVAVSCWSSA